MNLQSISSPIGYTGITFVLAPVFRLNQTVAMFYNILPDLVDKPSSALLETGGRYVSHAMLFVFHAAAFFLWRRWWGLVALVGGLSHLIIDRFDGSGFIPWFFCSKIMFSLIGNSIGVDSFIGTSPYQVLATN